MILVTVGTQLPFDRLVKAVDLWHEKNLDHQVVYQIACGNYKPKNSKYVDYMDAGVLDQLQKEADLVIGHAGIGTIISRLAINKPILIMPRLYSLGEHRNDHQVATVKRFSKVENIVVAENEDQLSFCIDEILKCEFRESFNTESRNLDFLIDNLKKYFTR